ncbi:hypothetical protein [Streptomyces sp. BA2]|uniref:hypothetical protein n=1 Tax=Streptomyces sp. BA2 TaxID=436595 RepID=UPI0019225EB5|nr:hypothetical protein [Streptomyces sp. BA2]
MTEHKAVDYSEYVDQVWRGEETLLAHLTGAHTGDELVRLRERVGFFPAFANVAVFDTADGVVLATVSAGYEQGWLMAAAVSP